MLLHTEKIPRFREFLAAWNEQLIQGAFAGLRVEKVEPASDCTEGACLFVCGSGVEAADRRRGSLRIAIFRSSQVFLVLTCVWDQLVPRRLHCPTEECQVIQHCASGCAKLDSSYGVLLLPGTLALPSHSSTSLALARPLSPSLAPVLFATP